MALGVAAPVIVTLFWLVIRLVGSTIWDGATLAEITGETVVPTPRFFLAILPGLAGVDLAVAVGVGVERILARGVGRVGVPSRT